MSFRFLFGALVILLVFGGNAFGQGTYVSASVFGDIARSTQTEYPGSIDIAPDGEAIGFALRLGTPLGSVWGVEVEYAHPGKIENEGQPRVLPLAQPAPTFTPIGELPGGISIFQPSVAPTIFPYSVRTTQQNTTLSTALWFHQQLSARVALVYLGGMGFYRSEHEFEYTFPRLLGGIPPELIAGVIALPFQSKMVRYGVRPLAGVESRIAMTDRLQLVAGIRLQASQDIWLIRPSAGLGWTF